MKLYIIINSNIFIEPHGNRYPGIKPNIEGMYFFLIIILFPFEEIKNKKITSFIFFITKYNGGINNKYINYFFNLFNIIQMFIIINNNNNLIYLSYYI